MKQICQICHEIRTRTPIQPNFFSRKLYNTPRDSSVHKKVNKKWQNIKFDQIFETRTMTLTFFSSLNRTRIFTQTVCMH